MSFGLQRINLRYKISDLLSVKVGRLHTPLGYWNEVFHHGSWLQTTVGRPEIYRFEREDGGFLPVHSVGLELSGEGEIASVDLGYNAYVLNGRGRTVTEVQHVKDKNDSKGFGVLFKAKPHAIEGLQFGPLVYWDRIPGDPPTAGRTDHIDELILGAHTRWRLISLRLMNCLCCRWCWTKNAEIFASASSVMTSCMRSSDVQPPTMP